MALPLTFLSPMNSAGLVKVPLTVIGPVSISAAFATSEKGRPGSWPTTR